MYVKQLFKSFFFFLSIILIENKFVFGMNPDTDNIKSPPVRKGRVDKPYIPSHLLPSTSLIAAAELGKNVPLKYDSQDDVYYQEHKAIKETSKLSKNKKKTLSKAEKKILKQQPPTNRTECSEFSVQEKERRLRQFIQQFSLPVEEELSLDLDSWKEKVLKIEGRDNLFDELHKSSVNSIIIDTSTPYAGYVSHNGSKTCGYKGWFGTCTNSVRYYAKVQYKGEVECKHDINSHKCLCHEVEQLALALQQEQEKNSIIIKNYKKIYEFVQHSLLSEEHDEYHSNEYLYDLGITYLKGDGVEQNSSEAARLFRLAAEKGHADAQYNLGAMYVLGEGVVKDTAEAEKWFTLAKNQGHVDASCSSLGKFVCLQKLKKVYIQKERWE